jgi:hypothetical protein
MGNRRQDLPTIQPAFWQDLRKNHWHCRLLEFHHQVVRQQTMLDLINRLPPQIRKCLQACPDEQRTSNGITLNPHFAALTLPQSTA